jgi:hypothetical protein
MKIFLQVQRENFEILKSELDGTEIYNDLKMGNIFSYEQFVKEVSIRGYDEFKPYVDRLIEAIEGNTFTEEQVSAMLENKKVLGSKKEILEVQNAIKIYENINSFKLDSSKHVINLRNDDFVLVY